MIAVLFIGNRVFNHVAGIDHCLSRENGWKPLKTQDFCRILWYNVCMENREMQTSNTEEMATISRAEYERLQQENAQLEAKSAKLEEAHARMAAKFAAREQEPVSYTHLSMSTYCSGGFSQIRMP